MSIDSRSDESFLNKQRTKYGRLDKLSKPAKWVTSAGAMTTTRTYSITFELNEFSDPKEIF